MMFQFYFKKMGSSETLKVLSQKKLSDLLERFVGANGLVRLTFQTERNAQRVLCHLQGHNGQTYRASASSDNMYANLDIVAHKLEAQLLKEKTRTLRSKSRIQANLPITLGDERSKEIADDEFYEFEDYPSSLRNLH